MHPSERETKRAELQAVICNAFMDCYRDHPNAEPFEIFEAIADAVMDWLDRNADASKTKDTKP